LSAGTDTLICCPECGGAWPGPDSPGNRESRRLSTARDPPEQQTFPILRSIIQAGQRIRDDRGVRVELGHLRLRARLRQLHSSEREHLVTVDRSIRRIGRPLRWLVSGFLILLGAASAT